MDYIIYIVKNREIVFKKETNNRKMALAKFNHYVEFTQNKDNTFDIGNDFIFLLYYKGKRLKTVRVNRRNG